MSNCKCRGFPPTLPSDYQSKELLGEDKSGQELFLVDGAAVYVLVRRNTANRPITLLAQLYGITREDVLGKGDYC